jgi:hypothetical protein
MCSKDHARIEIVIRYSQTEGEKQHGKTNDCYKFNRIMWASQTECDEHKTSEYRYINKMTYMLRHGRMSKSAMLRRKGSVDSHPKEWQGV